MYRPVRTGSFPILNLGKSWNPTTTQLQGFPEDQIRPVFQNASVPGDYNNVTIDENADFTLASASGFTLAVACDGELTNNMPHHVVYSLAVSIISRVEGANNRASVNLRGWLGYAGSSFLPTVSSSAQDSVNYITLLPAQAISIGADRHAVITADREFSQLSAEGQVIVEQGVGQVAYTPLFVGFSVSNPDAESVVTVTNISASMAIHKYTADIDTFDPTR